MCRQTKKSNTRTRKNTATSFGSILKELIRMYVIVIFAIMVPPIVKLVNGFLADIVLIFCIVWAIRYSTGLNMMEDCDNLLKNAVNNLVKLCKSNFAQLLYYAS